MAWRFNPYPKYMVETDVTQRDQFKNDDVDLADSLGRESTQNSLDAALPGQGPVKLRFSFLTGLNAPDAAFVEGLFADYESHARAAGIDFGAVPFGQPTALVVEDFGTKGLTGSTEEKDNDNFSDFWRRHGRSHKSGSSLGRWGLGKLVYSMSSQLKAFLALTVQSDSGKAALMGQSVLGMHRVGDTDYAAHNYFSDETEERLPIPIKDEAFVARFKAAFRLQRKTEPGLSVVIPFPMAELTPFELIRVAIENYFIPILRNRLVVDVDEASIDKGNILQLAKSHPGSGIRDVEQVFGFVTEADATSEFFRPANPEWYREKCLAEAAFAPEDILEMRERFVSGKLVGVELPIKIDRTIGGAVTSHYRIFLKRSDELTRGQDFYVRGSITLPQEAKFRDRKALGMLLAEDDGIATFLGDAENAAHTRWNGQAEKLLGYRSARDRLKAIRNSLVELHDHLVQAVEEKEDRALLDFFSIPGEGNQPKPKNPKETPPRPDIPKPERLPAIRVTECEGGIVILPGRAILEEELPINATVQIAYDVSQGNPFKLHSIADFDLGDENSVGIAQEGPVHWEADTNRLRFEITGPEFEVRLTGFDPKRDLIVRADA